MTQRMIKGACSCGAVAFEAHAQPAGIYVCHCSLCRRSTGANGIAVVLVPDAAFRWVCGEANVATWKNPDADWATWFCRTCGARVPGRNDAASMFVPAGCITEGGDALRVIHHVFVGSKAEWDHIGDTGAQHHAHIAG